ncbi:Na-translocating system protein MpsC family protein [Marinococcus halophilus]|uniref:Na+-translocating membrane potential-generating system MpsC domain-containing protein n=1 Tax=Marinococcus halophilus TaxID=1371 RepID=A0A510Y4V4_MARHA|nr:Na-translocating system protein MpsC family protein [Marinococcus halophilus]GEK58173.1 hypothetical protein MHA01_10780 [Marinococcus halophilus]
MLPADIQQRSRQEQQKELGSHVSRVLREHFGRGPESVYVSLDPHSVVIHIRKFLAPMEEVLLDQHGQEAVEELRETMMAKMLPEVSHALSQLMEREGWTFFVDWNMTNRSGMITALHEPSFQNHPSLEDSPHQSSLQEGVRQVSVRTEKVPGTVYAHQINDRTFIVVRSDVLIMIEKELIRTGYGKTLKTVKRQLEKRLLYEEQFDRRLGVEIRDIFVDWDFEQDTSVVVLLTDPLPTNN